jgi:hypothetical protein
LDENKSIMVRSTSLFEIISFSSGKSKMSPRSAKSCFTFVRMMFLRDIFDAPISIRRTSNFPAMILAASANFLFCT